MRARGVIVVWSDIGCPWAHVAVSRLHRFRSALDLEGAVSFEHRAFPLELVNRRATPKALLAAETPATASIEPQAGWQPWAGPPGTWPVTTVPALEAVRAARGQSPEAAEQLDIGLRRAFFAESRCISLRTEILAVAASCPSVDAVALEAAIDDGVGRRQVIDEWRQATTDESPVDGSPHLFLPDGSAYHNPGIRFHWPRGEGVGYPVIDDDDPGVYEAILTAAAG